MDTTVYATSAENSLEGQNAKMFYPKERGCLLDCVNGTPTKSSQASHQRLKRISKNATFSRYIRHQRERNSAFKKRYSKTLSQKAAAAAQTVATEAEATAMTNSRQITQWNSKTRKHSNIKKSSHKAENYQDS